VDKPIVIMKNNITSTSGHDTEIIQVYITVRIFYCIQRSCTSIPIRW